MFSVSDFLGGSAFHLYHIFTIDCVEANVVLSMENKTIVITFSYFSVPKFKCKLSVLMLMLLIDNDRV